MFVDFFIRRPVFATVCALMIILAGAASGKLKGGRHIRNPKDTTMSNLLLAVLDKLGVQRESFGDSTGLMVI